ncbi:hypothetical protein [Nannocystis punicea]|uniref:Uncharacterized protein n=1 Tax=Nannocystis punicea TaxID=2995304 RepID=A0ABY7HDA8_9BACT|nr:hypothetical protein [Nannocystis poenicansa]WAS97070.1 hypothetical protein O0S08_13060 [Nannocystis poenicansa]
MRRRLDCVTSSVLGLDTCMTTDCGCSSDAACVDGLADRRV